MICRSKEEKGLARNGILKRQKSSIRVFLFELWVSDIFEKFVKSPSSTAPRKLRRLRGSSIEVDQQKNKVKKDQFHAR